MSIDLGVIVRVVLVGVFSVAAISKALSPHAGRRALSEFGVPAPLAPALSLALSAMELAVALLLLPARTARAAALAALVLLTCFTTVIISSLLRGRRPDCACFGRLLVRPVGWSTVARNAILAGFAGVVLVAGPGHPAHAVQSVRRVLASTGLLQAGALAMLVAIAGEGVLVWQLFKQQGRLLLRLDRLDARVGLPEATAPGEHTLEALPLGSSAPRFQVATPAGHPVTLDGLLASAQPVVLIFSDPSCPICTTLLPTIAAWQRAYADRLEVVLVSCATDERVRLAWQRGEIAVVLLQREHELAEAYRVPATPAAIAIGVAGDIRSVPRLGAEAIEALLREESAHVPEIDRTTQEVPA